MATKYVKVVAVGVIGDIPAGENVNTQLIYGNVAVADKYRESYVTMGDYDYIVYKIAVVQDAYPTDPGADDGTGGLAWRAVEVDTSSNPNPNPNPNTDPDNFKPSVRPSSSSVYSDSWSDSWVDSKGLRHYYPQSGAYAELYKASDLDNIQVALSIVGSQGGGYDAFKKLCKEFGIKSSMDDEISTASSSSPQILPAKTALHNVHKKAFEALDAYTVESTKPGKPDPGDDAAENAYWKAQKQASYSFDAMFEKPSVIKAFEGTPTNTQEKLVDALTSQVVGTASLPDGYQVFYSTQSGKFTLPKNIVSKSDVQLLGSINDDEIAVSKIKSVVATLGSGNDKMSGSSGNDILRGGDGKDILRGGAGHDELVGGAHADRLTGGSGDDAFIFNVRPSKVNIDHITDFKRVDDTIELENSGSGLFSRLARGAIDLDEFATIKSKASNVDKDVHILYDKARGVLYYDPNGGNASGRIEFAVLDNHETLTHRDFIVL